MLANSTLPFYLQVAVAFVYPLVAFMGIIGYKFLVYFRWTASFLSNSPHDSELWSGYNKILPLWILILVTRKVPYIM